MPATVPHGGLVTVMPFCEGSAICTFGKYTAAFPATSRETGGLVPPMTDTAFATDDQPGGSTSRIARRSTHSVAAGVKMSAGAPGRQSRLKMSVL